MKIDHNPINSGAVSLGSTDRVEADKRAEQGAAAKGGSSDSLELSSEAQLLHSALKAAREAPATRADRIEDVRNKLVTGELGRDAERLAERLIDDLLGT